MDAVKFLEERKRMFKSGKPVPDLDVDITYNSEKAVKIVEEWSAAHPRKTRQSVFLEQYPQADIDNNGLLVLCPKRISADVRATTNCMRGRCDDCRRKFWLREVK
jgi:hypothetical protein